MDGIGRGRLSARRGETASALRAGLRQPRSMPPASGIACRALDPSVAASIAEIDPALVVRWDPEGIWWTPASMIPPGVTERGAWHISVRGVSGALRGMRMWHPECADGRLVDYLRATWGAMLYANRSLASPGDVRRARIGRARGEKDRLDREMFDAWWRRIDHGEMRRAVAAEHNDPKWRPLWQVHADTPAAPPAPAAPQGT